MTEADDAFPFEPLRVFAKGDRVILSPKALQSFGTRSLIRRQCVATVVGFARHDPAVWVLWDGMKTRECLYAGFLERV